MHQAIPTLTDVVKIVKPHQIAVGIEFPQSQKRYFQVYHTAEKLFYDIMTANRFDFTRVGFHEVIQGNLPCKFYVDIEVDLKQHPTFILQQFIHDLKSFLESKINAQLECYTFNSSRDSLCSAHIIFPTVQLSYPLQIKAYLMQNKDLLKWCDTQVYPSQNSVKSLRLPYSYKTNGVYPLLPYKKEHELPQFEIFINGLITWNRINVIEKSAPTEPIPKRLKLTMESNQDEELQAWVIKHVRGKFLQSKLISADLPIIPIKHGTCPFKHKSHASNTQFMMITKSNLILKCHNEECKGYTHTLLTRDDSSWKWPSNLLEDRLQNLMSRYGKVWFHAVELGLPNDYVCSDEVVYDEYTQLYAFKWAAKVHDEMQSHVTLSRVPLTSIEEQERIIFQGTQPVILGVNRYMPCSPWDNLLAEMKLGARFFDSSDRNRQGNAYSMLHTKYTTLKHGDLDTIDVLFMNDDLEPDYFIKMWMDNHKHCYDWSEMWRYANLKKRMAVIIDPFIQDHHLVFAWYHKWPIYKINVKN